MNIVFGLIFLFTFANAIIDRDCSWMSKRLKDNETKDTRKVDGRDVKTEEFIDRIYPFAKDLEKLINIHIKVELNAFYNYLSMSHFFMREDYDLQGFSKYFHEAAMEELKHAEMFMKYQAKRSGRVTFFDITAPLYQTFTSGQQAMQLAFELEQNVTGEVLCLHKMAGVLYNDVDFTNFIESEVIPEQYTGLKELKTSIKTLSRMASSKGKNDMLNYGMAEFHFDQHLLNRK